MNATLYKDLSDASAIVEIKAGLTVYENFEGITLEDKVILVNGHRAFPDYIVRENDCVVIRSIPTGLTTTAILMIGGLALLAVGAIVVGVKLYNLKKQADELESKLSNLKDTISNIPYLEGASNSVATGKSQPYVIGTHLFTPYLLAKGHSTISGTDGIDQYYHVVLEGGFNSQVIRKLSCDDVVLKNFGTTGTVPQEGVSYFDKESIFYDENSLIEISQDGNAFATAAFNQKIVSLEPGDELKKAGESGYQDLIYTLEDNTMSANICILINGLRIYSNKDGKKRARGMYVIPYYSTDAGENWTEFYFNQNGTPSNYFTGNTISQLRYQASVNFTYLQVSALTSPILIKLVCPDGAYDGTAYDDVFVQWVQSKIYDPDASAALGNFVPESLIGKTERAVSTLIGLKIKATVSNQDKLDKINAITSGVARTWTGSAWTTSRTPTSNPAAWILEVLTSHTHLPSQMDDSEIDLDSLGELYEYCETNGLAVDMVLTDGDTKQTLLQTLADVSNSVLYRDVYGQLAAATDTAKANAIAVLNTQNLLSFENTKEMARLTDGIRISYVNADDGYVKDSYLVMRDGVTRTSESIIRDVSVTGITQYSQIVKYARRLMAIESLRPKSVVAKVGKEGVYFTPLAKVLVQHPSLKIGIGSAEIREVVDNGTYITGLTFYEPIEYDSTDVNGFGLVIQCVSSTYSTPLAAAYTATANGRVSEIIFTTPISLGAAVIPHPGDIVSYGYLNSGAFDTITSPFLIAGLEPDNEGWALQLVDYNEAIYDAGTIPTYTPNITSKREIVSVPSTIPPSTLDDIADVTARLVSGDVDDLPDDVSVVVATAEKDRIKVEAAWSGTGIANSLTGFIFSYTKDGSVWNETTANTNVFEYIFNRDVDGYPEASDLSSWRFRVKAVNAYGYTPALWGGTEAGVSVVVTGYLGWTPAVPSTSTSENGRGPAIGWNEASTWYGKGSHDIQISKGYTIVDSAPVLITDTGTLVAYAPALGLNPKESYDNYKTGAVDGYLTREGSTLALSLPLYGQNETDSLVFDTPYYIRARSSSDVPTSANPTARTTSAWSSWDLVYARASSAQDLVENAIKSGHVTDNAITANKIYVEMLAAISANLGVITDGAMAGSANNYWALSRVYDTDGITVLYYEGAMRVGGANQYLKVTPVVVGGVVTDYTIDFKVGTFTVTATGSTVNGDFVVKSYDGTQTLMSVDKTTGAVTINSPAITSDSNQVATTAFVKDVAQLNSHLTRAMQINGDGVPMIPDNVAGTYQKYVGFTSSPVYVSGATAIVENGALKLTVTTTGNWFAIFPDVTEYNSALLHIEYSATPARPMSLVSGGITWTPIAAHQTTGSRQILTGYTDVQNRHLEINNEGWSVGDVVYIYSEYIGSGLYDTPVYDKACCNRFTNNGVLPVKGNRGLALSFNGAQYLQADNPIVGISGTLAVKLKNITGGVIAWNESYNANGFSLFKISSILAVLRLSYNGNNIQIDISCTDNSTMCICFTNGSINIYVDSRIVASSSFSNITQGTNNLRIGAEIAGASLVGVLEDIVYDSRIWTQADVTRYHLGDDVVDSQQKAITAVPHSIVTRDANGNIEGNNFVAKTTGNYEIEIGRGASATGNYSIASGLNASATGASSVASGHGASATGGYSIASGYIARTQGQNAIAIGSYTDAGGDSSVAIGDDADTSLPYEININNRIRYLQFASTETQATVYTALSALMNPVVGSHTATMGHFGDVPWVSVLKRNAATGIQIFNSQSQSVAGFNSTDTNQIGSDFQIAFVQYVNV